MIGRAAIGYPWIFREIHHYMNTGDLLPTPTVEERVTVSKIHLRKSIEWKGPVVGINEMRRHYANYLRGLPGIKEFRNKLVVLKTMEEVEAVLDEVQKHYRGFEVERTDIVLENYHEHCAI
jgi:tRNA-dihydrouridine synthase